MSLQKQFITLENIITATEYSLKNFKATTPKEISKIICECLQFDPQKRLTAVDLEEKLGKLCFEENTVTVLEEIPECSGLPQEHEDLDSNYEEEIPYLW